MGGGGSTLLDRSSIFEGLRNSSTPYSRGSTGSITVCFEDEEFGGQSNGVSVLRVSQRELEENLAKSKKC